MSEVLSLVFFTLHQWFDFLMPYGVTFGAVIVAIFGLPILVRAFRKLMG